MKCLELFSGIGGFSAACPANWRVVQAIDINQAANAVYALNFPHPVMSMALESIGTDELQQYGADLWWLSPPCQPFTTRGLQRDIHDPRCQGLLNIMLSVEQIRPSYLLLENVPLFRKSIAADRLREILKAQDYHFCESMICPTSLGIANRRQRYYLIASRWHPIKAEMLFPFEQSQTFKGKTDELKRRVGDVLIETNWQDPSLQIAVPILSQYESSMHWVDPDQFPDGISSCFTSAYGQSPVYSGSYLRRLDQTRYFSAIEIVRMLGFHHQFRFPESLSQRQCWSLAGNSLSIDTIKLLVNVVIESQSLT